MIKIVAAARRRPGMSQAAYFDYIVRVHGAIARAKPLGVRRYVQNHVIDGAYGATGDPAHLTVLPRDSVTELWFDDPAAMAATFADPYTRDVIGPDGANFSDMPTALSLLTGERDDVGASGADDAKILYFLKAAPGVAPEAFGLAWQAAHASAAAALGTAPRRALRSMVLPPPPGAPAGGGSDYFGGAEMIRYDGMQSLWFDPATAAAQFRDYESVLTGDAAGWLDRSRSFWLLVREVVIFDRT